MLQRINKLQSLTSTDTATPSSNPPDGIGEHTNIENSNSVSPNKIKHVPVTCSDLVGPNNIKHSEKTSHMFTQIQIWTWFRLVVEFCSYAHTYCVPVHNINIIINFQCKHLIEFNWLQFIIVKILWKKSCEFWIRNINYRHLFITVMSLDMEGFRKREPLGLLPLIFCKIFFHDSDLVRRFSNITALVSLLLSMSENYLCDLHILAPAPRYHFPKRFRDCIPGIAASKPQL
jgi:hypothetical protein